MSLQAGALETVVQAFKAGNLGGAQTAINEQKSILGDGLANFLLAVHALKEAIVTVGSLPWDTSKEYVGSLSSLTRKYF